MKIDELPKSIILKDEHFKKCLDIIIETIKIKIWNSDKLLSHYTKHGIDHSERIAQYLGKLLEDFPTLLNPQERFVLLAAIFLHDIGNQLPKYVGIPIKSTYSIEELEIIRKNHHLTSCQAIKDSIKANAKLSLGLNLCKEYTDFIALLCKYHRKLDLSDLKDTSIAGDPLRLHLLGAFLRLGDELDADYRRVDMEVLNIIDIPIESKFYWWSHHYVQSISIDQGHIKLFFWFPEEYKNNDIVEIFKTKRKESLREQFLEVYDIFENYGVRLYRDIEIEDTNYLSAGSLKQVPPDLLEHIKITITQTRTNYKKLSAKTGVAWEINGVPYSDNEKVVKALAKIPQLMNKYKYKEAVRIIDDTRLLTMLPKDRMIFSGIAGNCYLALCDFNKAKSYYMDQLRLSVREDLRNIYSLDTIFAWSVSLGNMGIVYRIQGKLTEALKFFQQALEIHRAIGDKEGEANALNNMGVVYEIQSKLTEALKFFQQALEIHRAIGNKKGEANALDNMGIVYEIQSKLTEALQHYQKALDIYREIGNKEGEASALGNMGNVYRIQGKLEKAFQHYRKALNIHREIGNKEGEATNLCNIGIAYQTQDKLKEALDHYQQALDIDRKIGDKRGEANDLGNMGSVYRIQGKLKEALNKFKEALEIFKALENSTNIKKIIKIIKDLGEK